MTHTHLVSEPSPLQHKNASQGLGCGLPIVASIERYYRTHSHDVATLRLAPSAW